MGRKSKSAILILVMTVAITGCGKGSHNETEKSVQNKGTVQNEGESKEDEKTEGTVKEEDLKILLGNTDAGYDTEDGRYYVNMEEEVYTIRYIDYKAKKEVYLCNKLNCKHNNKNCTALIPNQSANEEYALFGDGEHLYILCTPYDSDGSMTVISNSTGSDEGILSVGGQDTEPPKIYRMDKDGTNREKVFEFESGVITEEKAAGDGKYLYLVTKKLDSETKGNATYTSSYDRKIVKVDLEKGTSENVADLKSGQNIIGCSGRNLIVSEDDFGREVSVEEKQDDDQYEQLYNQSRCVICSINVDSKKITELKSIKNSADKLHTEQIWNDRLYVSYEKEKHIDVLDLKSGETRKLNVGDSYNVEQILSVKGEADVIVASRYYDMGKENASGWNHYLINTENGEVTKSTLQTRYKTPISIEAQTEDYLYVQNDYKNDTEYVAWAGVHQEYISEVEYSIISKKDYLSNRANYEKVEMLNKGKLK